MSAITPITHTLLTTQNQEQAQGLNLRECVKQHFRKYIASLNGQEPKDVYALFMAEMEVPLIEILLTRNHCHETKTARQLGIARMTLRTLRKKYEIPRKCDL